MYDDLPWAPVPGHAVRAADLVVSSAARIEPMAPPPLDDLNRFGWDLRAPDRGAKSRGLILKIDRSGGALGQSLGLDWPQVPWQVLKLYGMSVRVSHPDALQVAGCRLGGGAGIWPIDPMLTTRQVVFVDQPILRAPNMLTLELTFDGPGAPDVDVVYLELDLLVMTLASDHGRQSPATWDAIREEVEAERAALVRKIVAEDRARLLADLVDGWDPDSTISLPPAEDRVARAARLIELLGHCGLRFGSIGQQVRDLVKLLGPERLLAILEEVEDEVSAEGNVVMETPQIQWGGHGVLGTEVLPDAQPHLGGLRAYPRLQGPYAVARGGIDVVDDLAARRGPYAAPVAGEPWLDGRRQLALRLNGAGDIEDLAALDGHIEVEADVELVDFDVRDDHEAPQDPPG